MQVHKMWGYLTKFRPYFSRHLYFVVELEEIITKCRRDNTGVLHCYKLHVDSKTLSIAKAECVSLGQHLVTISSNEEFEFVTKYLRECKKAENVHCCSHENVLSRYALFSHSFKYTRTFFKKYILVIEK